MGLPAQLSAEMPMPLVFVAKISYELPAPSVMAGH
jgi:hypothetical protein